jgi:hypothetical protein
MCFMQILSVELFASWILVHEKYFLDQIIIPLFRSNVRRLQPSKENKLKILLCTGDEVDSKKLLRHLPVCNTPVWPSE